MADVDLTCNENFDEFFSYPGTLNPTIEARLESLSILRSQEVREEFQFSSQYLGNPVLDPPIREHMVDCLITFSMKLDLKFEAVFLAVNVLDRYLDATRTYNPNDVKSLLIGCLYHGATNAYRFVQMKDCPPESVFRELAQPPLSQNEMSLTVQNIADAMHGVLDSNTSLAAMRYMVKKNKYALFILLITLFEHKFLRVPPLLVAAVAVQISDLLNPDPDSRSVTYVVSSAYPLEKVRECYRLLFSMLMDSSKALKIKAMHPVLSHDLGLPLDGDRLA